MRGSRAISNFSFLIISSRPGAIATADTRASCETKDGPPLPLPLTPRYLFPRCRLVNRWEQISDCVSAGCWMLPAQRCNRAPPADFASGSFPRQAPLSTVLPKCSTIPLTFSFVRIRGVATGFAFEPRKKSYSSFRDETYDLSRS